MHPGLKTWRNLLTYAYNAFSIPLLVNTLFSPFKRDTSRGSHFSFLERFVFAIFSRVLGFITRVILIAIGLIFTILVLLTFPIFLLMPITISTETLQGLPTFGASLSYGDTYTLNAHSMDVISPSSLLVVGKEKPLRMMERALSKDTSRNILLVGENGSGKSTFISYLGRLGKSGLSFPGIKNHRVVELAVEGISMPDFDKSLEEALKAGNVILAIENIHLYTELYERMMPYLETLNLGIVVTTDFANYDQVLKKYPEFLSKFEKVDILPTNPTETLAVLQNKRALTGARIKDEALEEIVRLSDRFIGNQSEPMKSILILEELRALKREITLDDVRQIISDKTNVPLGAMSGDERKVLQELEATMKKKIIGQDEAVADVSEALRRLRAGISDPTKPAGSFLFLGPTGVGKTYTAKILAESYFGRKNAMIRFDMSEFSLDDSVTLFSDRLASVIEEAPLSLVFFDELEKSNRAIQHLLLQVLDEGRLTRGSGRVASFKDAIIIATSNAGSKDIMANPHIDKKSLIDNLIKNSIFAPEFLNRFSGIILFRPLDIAQARIITALMLGEFKERLLADKNINLEVTDALIDKVSSAGFDPEFGARPIKRAMEEIVENRVADYIISGAVGGTLKIL